MNIHAEILVSGFVQGVGFRYFTQQRARRYDLAGYVRNLPGGKVYCEVEGERGLVHDFIKELKIGPPMSRVTHAQVSTSEELQGYSSFEVRF